jgi:hypothetical protein
MCFGESYQPVFNNALSFSPMSRRGDGGSSSQHSSFCPEACIAIIRGLIPFFVKMRLIKRGVKGALPPLWGFHPHTPFNKVAASY